MKISIIGYRNHAIRLKELLEKMGHDETFNYNHHVNSESDIQDSDVFFISSPSETHMDWIEKLSKYNKYIFCEKPPVTNLEDLEKIKDYRDKLYFNFNYRFSYLGHLLENYNKNNELGSPIYVNCISTHGIAFKDSFQKNWRFNNKNILSSIIGNLGIHYIDFLSYLFGPINDLDLKYLSIVSPELPDTCKLTINLENCFSDVLLSYAAPFENKIRVIYDNGIVELSNGIVTVSKPRDTFDEHGFFSVPKSETIKQYNNSRDYYNDSLVNSIKYFLHYAKNNFDIPVHHHNQSIQSNEILLDIFKNSSGEERSHKSPV